MKKTVMIILVGFMLVVSACGSSSQAAASATPGTDGLEATSLTIYEKLAIGTLKLEGTDLAVDGKTAAALLPLWKAARALQASDTISSLEMAALYQQIEDTMSSEQVKAIEAMTFSDDDITALTADLGIGVEAKTEQASVSDQVLSDLPAMPSDGGMPGGDLGMAPAGDMGGVAMVATSRDAQISTSGQVSNRSINIFIDPLINLLKEKTTA